MRPLTPNERFLVSILGSVVLVLGSIMGLKWINNAQTQFNAELQQAISDQTIAQVLLEEQSVAEERLKWIAQNEVPIGDRGVAQAKVLETLKAAAEQNKLEIEQQSVGEIEDRPAGVSIAASMDAKGPMESVIRWIHAFQSVKDFYAIEKCTLKVDPADPQTVIGSLTVRRFFCQEGGT